MSQIITVDGESLLVHVLDGRSVVEAYELALFLGYAQQHSVRKQVLGHWAEDFAAGRDYLLVTRAQDIRDYEAAHARAFGGELRPVSPERGRMFLLPDGLRQVLERSSKAPAAGLLEALEREQLAPHASPDHETRTSPDARERREREYEVLQRLLEQLREIDEDHLALLAIEAAEVMLERRLTDVRSRLLRRGGPLERGPRGPIFGDEGFYSLTQIGKKAGGYSAKAAGRAANVVAARWGLEPEDIRTRELWFNELRPWTDDRGVEHQIFRFDREFSNLVVDELRASSKFKPDEAPFPTFDPGAPVTDIGSLMGDG